ncbi:MAG: AraC family transcriptional regulator [Ruminococcaceae bacterium]|nr:AraC family transcriptional regulator [Oscillospiraceae bacterium]
MTVQEITQALGLEVLSAGNPDASVEGCYICDLLSLAMSKVSEHDAWITVQTNINIVAIAVLTELSCVIIAEKMQVDESVLEKAREENVAVLRSDKSAFEIAMEIGNRL